MYLDFPKNIDMDLNTLKMPTTLGDQTLNQTEAVFSVPSGPKESFSQNRDDQEENLRIIGTQ